MRFTYRTEQWLPHSIERVFAFFANPYNLPLLLPPWQRARIDMQSLVPAPSRPHGATGLEPVAAGAGSKVTLSLRPFPNSPVRVSWEAEISEFVWNEHFCDRQLRGPFAYWNHCHSVSRVDQPGMDATLITDEVQYEVPFGIAGEIAHRLFLRQQIERTFIWRQIELARLLADVTPEPDLLLAK